MSGESGEEMRRLSVLPVLGPPGECKFYLNLRCTRELAREYTRRSRICTSRTCFNSRIHTTKRNELFRWTTVSNTTPRSSFTVGAVAKRARRTSGFTFGVLKSVQRATTNKSMSNGIASGFRTRYDRGASRGRIERQSQGAESKFGKTESPEPGRFGEGALEA